MTKKIFISASVLIVIAIVTFLMISRNHGGSQKDYSFITETYTLGEGELLAATLKNSSLKEQEISGIIQALARTFDLRHCHIGDTYEIITQKTDGSFIKFNYHPSPFITYVVTRDQGNNFSAAKTEAVLEKKVVSYTGAIKTSLYEAMTQSGESPEVVLDFADIFAYEIDFLTDPRVGDTFTIVYEKYFSEEKFVKNGKILAAEYTSSQKTHEAFYYEFSDGRNDYFNAEGKSLRRAFLRSPLNYRRISSHFTHKRWHPILKIFRPHLGIDYAAPTGTPIVSIGEGVVEFCGWNGGFGRLIRVRHPNGYTTMYGHLHRYAPRIRKGVHVSRGQVIAYVGSSGLSTGPHLDFRITQNGKFINFLALRLPEASSISPRVRSDFEKVRKERVAQFNAAQKQSHLVSLPADSTR